MNASNDPVHTFLMEAHHISVQAQFIVDSLPNADNPAVERSTHQLGAVWRVVAVIDDPESQKSSANSSWPLWTGFSPLWKSSSPTRLPNLVPLSQGQQLGRDCSSYGCHQENIVSAPQICWHLESSPRIYRDHRRALDEIVAEISLFHPFVGSVIVSGHLESRGFISLASESRTAFDASMKSVSSSVVSAAVREFGWPSRMRGDFGTENNEVERLMIAFWGVSHRAYLRGRSRHNVRIERLWRDVRKDALETFRQIFDYLEQNELLDMENPIHNTYRDLRAQPHSRYHRWLLDWDPGDDVNTVASDPLYGYDSEAPLPPTAMSDNEPLERTEQPLGTAAEREGGILVNGDEDLLAAKELLGDFDCDRDDGNWGIEVYCEAVIRMISQLNNNSSD
ncbi:hypothetical protein B0H13DRAFT_1930848 [Mycena leptocephala]|nr:hypothetical protein B0H13DRAFT_1930848 [Mycena leptocephala]